jgi:hypothetical protein
MSCRSEPLSEHNFPRKGSGMSMKSKGRSLKNHAGGEESLLQKSRSLLKNNPKEEEINLIFAENARMIDGTSLMKDIIHEYNRSELFSREGGRKD